jgi:hypothetical protein
MAADYTPFEGPDDLHQFVLDTAALLRESAWNEEAERLASVARPDSQSAYEWFGRIGTAADALLRGRPLPSAIVGRVRRLAATVGTEQPYGRDRGAV